MVNISDLSEIEREILTLAADYETTILRFETIQKNFNLDRKEVENIVNGLIEKGMAKLKHYDNDPPDEIYCQMEHGIIDNKYVDLKKLEEDYMDDMALRDRVCP